MRELGSRIRPLLVYVRLTTFRKRCIPLHHVRHFYIAFKIASLCLLYSRPWSPPCSSGVCAPPGLDFVCQYTCYIGCLGDRSWCQLIQRRTYTSPLYDMLGRPMTGYEQLWTRTYSGPTRGRNASTATYSGPVQIRMFSVCFCRNSPLDRLPCGGSSSDAVLFDLCQSVRIITDVRLRRLHQSPRRATDHPSIRMYALFILSCIDLESGAWLMTFGHALSFRLA